MAKARSTRYRRVWITGGSSGIGRALARHYRAAGAEVFLSARGPERLARVAEAIGAPAYPLDVTDPKAVHRTVEQIWKEHGPLDLAVLNAGGSPRGEGGLASVLEANLRLNTLAAAHAIDALRPRMRAAGGGTIALVGSLAGYLPLPGGYGYATSKAALIHFAAGLYPELRREGLDLRLVNPGFVRTPLVEANRFPMPFILEPEEAARRIARGLEGGRFEIAFPLRLAWPLRLLRALPLTAWVRVLAWADRRRRR